MSASFQHILSLYVTLQIHTKVRAVVKRQENLQIFTDFQQSLVHLNVLYITFWSRSITQPNWSIDLSVCEGFHG